MRESVFIRLVTHRLLLLEPHLLLILDQHWVPRLLHIQVCHGVSVVYTIQCSVSTYLRHPS